MQASIPLVNLTLKHKIIAMAIGLFSAVALAIGLGGAPAGATSGYDSSSYDSYSVDASALSLDATAFKEYTNYTNETLLVYYNKESYTNYVEYSSVDLDKADISKDSYSKDSYSNDCCGDYNKHDSYDNSYKENGYWAD